jgi:hypothetical protein
VLVRENKGGAASVKGQVGHIFLLQAVSRDLLLIFIRELMMDGYIAWQEGEDRAIFYMQSHTA